MTTDDNILLRVGMGRLEIEPLKLIKNVKEENPFANSLQKKTIFTKTNIQYNKCSCAIQKKKSNSIYKKKHKKLLMEPILRLSHEHNSLKSECQHLFSKEQSVSSSQCVQSDNLCLHTLVDNCNQLSISNKNTTRLEKNKNNYNSKWWNSEISNERQCRDLVSDRNSSCSQQALNPPCDVTIDELASYFETLVHIPKKMSSMAEMMYI